MLSRFITCLTLPMAFSLAALAQKPADNLHFKSNQNHMIAVYKGQIFVNAQPAYKFTTDNIVYKSKRNGLVEDKKSVFLVLEVTDGANKNKFKIFNINYSKADSVMTVIASDIKDYDQDGYVEFGGSEVTPVHPSPDSLYYTASRWYEFKKGQITVDKEYTEKVDLKVNKGNYLPDAFDQKGLIAIPKKKK